MYDSMPTFGSEERVLSGETVHSFPRNAKSQSEQLTQPQIYGWRIHDCRYPGLEKRVEGERQRLIEMRESWER